MSQAKRRAARIDENQPGIVEALEAIPGCSVKVDMDDIIVGFRGRNYWFEIKDPAKACRSDGTFKAGAVKDSQLKLAATWQGQYDIVTTIDQILEIIGA